MKHISFDVHEVAFLMARGITIHPTLAELFDSEIERLSHTGALCLTPITKLELYRQTYEKKLAAKQIRNKYFNSNIS